MTTAARTDEAEANNGENDNGIFGMCYAPGVMWGGREVVAVVEDEFCGVCDVSMEARGRLLGLVKKETIQPARGYGAFHWLQLHQESSHYSNLF